MEKMEEFSFGDDSVARTYDNVLVPVLFESWAKALIDHYPDWEGKHVLDLATGTGVVAKRLAAAVGEEGTVTAVDMNPQMLNLAKEKCKGEMAKMNFILSSADNMAIDNDMVDVLVCQQGFQFFPDKIRAAKEISRVLKKGGDVFVSTWCPVSECVYFGAICEALESIGETAISEMMKVPFDNLSMKDLSNPFKTTGFSNLKVDRLEQDLIIPGGLEMAINMAYATPIGPKLLELALERQNNFKSHLAKLLDESGSGKQNMGPMVSYVLTGRK